MLSQVVSFSDWVFPIDDIMGYRGHGNFFGEVAVQQTDSDVHFLSLKTGFLCIFQKIHRIMSRFAFKSR